MNTSDSQALRGDRLRIVRGDRTLAESVSFAVDPGEFWLISGDSGCGKSTLLRAVAGLIDPAAGSVTLNGRTPSQIGWPLFRSRVVYVHQQPAFCAGTIRENLERPFLYQVRGISLDLKNARSLLDTLRLPAAVLDAEAESLSIGERQRVALARALLVEPDFVLLDEPLSALDDDAAGRVAELLETKISSRELGILMAAHGKTALDFLVSRRLVFGKDTGQ